MRRLTLGVLAFFAAGCGCQGPGVTTVDDLSLEPATHDFGRVAVGQRAEAQFIVRNGGPSSVQLHWESVVTPFAMHLQPLAAAPGTSSFTISVTPTASGPYRALVAFTALGRRYESVVTCEGYLPGTPVDSGSPDSGSPDSGTPDAGTTLDSGAPDSGEPPDAGHDPDGGPPVPDAGMTGVDAGPSGSDAGLCLAFVHLPGIPVGVQPFAVTSGDFDKDGLGDFAVANTGSGTITVLHNAGLRTFTAQPQLLTGATPIALAAADLDSDGMPDLAVAAQGSGGAVVHFNDGGTLLPGLLFTTGFYVNGITAGDLDGDGRIDLAVANSGANTVGVLLQSSTGGFAPVVSVLTDPGPNSVTMGDFNGDGLMDLASANFDAISQSVTLILNQGAGSFSAMGPLSSVTSPVAVASGDLNGDGKVDLITANYNSSDVGLYFNAGAASFSPQTAIGVGTHPSQLAVADLDRDGVPEIIVANAGANTITIIGNVGGTFAIRLTLPSNLAPTTVIAGDFDRDGEMDLAATAHDANLLDVWFGGCAR